MGKPQGKVIERGKKIKLWAWPLCLCWSVDHTPKGPGFDPDRGTCLGCRFAPHLGPMWGASSWCVSHRGLSHMHISVSKHPQVRMGGGIRVRVREHTNRNQKEIKCFDL